MQSALVCPYPATLLFVYPSHSCSGTRRQALRKLSFVSRFVPLAALQVRQ